MEEQDPSGPRPSDTGGPGANYREDRENIQLRALHGGGSPGAPGDVPSTAVFSMTLATPAVSCWQSATFSKGFHGYQCHLMGLTTPQCPAASASGSTLLVLVLHVVKDIIQSTLAPPSHNSLFTAQPIRRGTSRQVYGALNAEDKEHQLASRGT